MFKLESYITPLLMGYIDKYVKLRHEDFQLSLWGGDAVLNKLDLRLEAIEDAIKLPIVFKSGHIYELRIHVPWTKLGSEPVIITINTIECILKLRDSAYEEHSHSSTQSGAPGSAVAAQPVRRQDAASDIPPGYLQGLINRVLNNINIIVNNLILKFVDDDIVLSVNVKSAECYSTDALWERSFIELSLPELVLRRVIDFHDLTVCLDRRNASGKIETYQDPLLYRCSLVCRIYTFYDNLHAKMPAITKMNVLCKKLELSLTDVQVPMFFRLVELCLALYYGTLELPSPQVADTEAPGECAIDMLPDASLDSPPQDEDAGWTSWAWSFVPQILPPEDEDNGDGGSYGNASGRASGKGQDEALLIVGFYCSKAEVVFKLTQVSQDGGATCGPRRVTFRPYCALEAEGINCTVLLKAVSFFTAQFGISSTRIGCVGNVGSGGRGEGQSAVLLEDSYFMRSGNPDVEKPLNYLTGSLFDPGGAENRQQQPHFITDEQRHLETYTESFALERLGTFFADYLYIMDSVDDGSKEGQRSGGSTRSSVSDQSQDGVLQENSSMKFILCPVDVIVSSDMVERIGKFVRCAMDHDYEPYSKQISELKPDANSPPPTDSQVAPLEQCVPSRTYQLVVLRPVVRVYAACRPQGGSATGRDHRNKRKKAKVAGSRPTQAADAPKHLLQVPCVVISAERLDIRLTTAMYPHQLVSVVSKMTIPSENLLHHSHAHLHCQLFALQLGVMLLEQPGQWTPTQNALQPCSASYYKKTLLLPSFWNNPLQPKTEQTYELPNLTVNLTKPQLMLIMHIAATWCQSSPDPLQLPTVSLVEDTFHNNYSSKSQVTYPVLVLSISGVDMKQCDTDAVSAVAATVSSLQATVLARDRGCDVVTPVLSGPVNTSDVHKTSPFNQQTVAPSSEGTEKDCVSVTWQLPKDASSLQAPAAFFLEMQGIVGCIDPVLLDWLTYVPTVSMQRVSSNRGKVIVVDATLADATSPLQNKGDSQSGSNVTTGQTDSQTPGQTHSKSGPTVPVASDRVTSDNVLTHVTPGWGKYLADMFPLVKRTELQLTIEGCCLFLPLHDVTLPAEPSMNIPENLCRAFHARLLPDTLVLCLPRVHASSADAPHYGAGAVEIPMQAHAFSHSVGGARLPWSLEITSFSAYSLHASRTVESIVKPVSASATVAVTTKYNSPTSDTISSLGLCVHVDMHPVALACCNAQLQLIYDLSLKLAATLGHVMEGQKVLEHILAPNSVTTAMGASSTAEPPRGVMTTGGHRRDVSSSSQFAPADVHVVTGTSESWSRDSVSPCHDAEDAVALSLWMQWTLLRLTGTLVSRDDSGHGVCLVTEVEDLTTAIDVQGVYSKVRCKVGSVNVLHRRQASPEDSPWELGNFGGVVLSCGKHLSKNVRIISNQLWCAAQTHDAMGDFVNANDEPKKRRDKSHAFLTFTYTRAQQRNVMHRMQKQSVGNGIAETAASNKGVVTSGATYLNEICLDLHPCDLVLNCPVFIDLLQVFTLKTPETKTNVDLMPPGGATVGTGQSLWFVSALPLIYINAANFRMFVPRIPRGAKTNNTASSRDTVDSACPSSTVSTTTITAAPRHDVCVFQVQSLSLAPNADNPLPRVVVERDVYRQALHAGITSQPGSEVEDRQYQLDMRGLSLSTGCWQHLLLAPAAVHSKDTDSAAAVQNPALEWNNLTTASDIEQVSLRPLAANFDLRIVVAPAIISRQPGQRLLLVCGTSIEVNASSNMDFYISTNQLRTLVGILNSNTATLSKSAAPESTTRQGAVPSPRQRSPQNEARPQDAACNDSGVESEKSSRITHAKSTPQVAPPASSPFASLSSIMPIDVLLTARKISLMVYTQTSDTVTHSPLTRQSFLEDLDIDASLRAMSHSDAEQKVYDDVNVETNSTGTTTGCMNSASSRHAVVRPYLYAYFSQPHSLMSMDQTQSKVELSCYDIVLKGTKLGYVFPEESKPLPDVSDFMVDWLETRPGRTDRLTGVPPSLYTLTATDLLQCANVTLCIERPLRLNLSTNLLRQLLHLQADLSACWETTDPSGTTPVSSSTAGQRLVEVGHIQLHTAQLVVVMETSVAPENACVQAAVLGIDSDVVAKWDDAELNEMNVSFTASDLLVKTSYRGKCRPLFGPATIGLNLECVWGPHSGLSHRPRVLVFLECGPVEVFIGQEHAMCAAAIHRHIAVVMQELQLWKNDSTALPKETHQLSARTDKTSHVRGEHGAVKIQHSSDDLRTGDFEFVVDETGSDVLPLPGEVMFGCDKHYGHSMLSWQFREPRLVTALDVNPLPFTITQLLNGRQTAVDLKVKCILEYWNVLRGWYEYYAEFELSEGESCHLELPSVTPTQHPCVVPSQGWRVVILHPVDRGEYVQLGDDLDIEPVVAPQTLFASLSVSSCFAAHLVPSVQAGVSVSTLKVRLANHVQHLGAETPAKLRPFEVDGAGPTDHEWMVWSVDNTAVSVSWLGDVHTRAHIQGETRLSCDVLEYRSATMRPLLLHTDIEGTCLWQQQPQKSSVKADVHIDTLHLRVAESTVHTLTTAQQAWSQFQQEDRSKCEKIVPHCYLVCNDTLQALRFGQIDTDESLVVASRQVYPYVWRSHKTAQLLRLCLRGAGSHWSGSVSLDQEGIFVVSIEGSDQGATLIVKVQQVTSVQKKVVVSGLVVVASRISQHLDVKLVSKATQRHQKEAAITLGANKALPSFVVNDSEEHSLKLRMMGAKMPWSQELVAIGDKVKGAKLVKIPLHDKGSFIHVWCHVFNEACGAVSRSLILLTPVFVVRSDLPLTLLMNIETPRLKSRHQVELPGRGSENQLHTMSADMTHNVTFRLGESRSASAPALTLASGMIEQVEQTPINQVDIDSILSQWPAEGASNWPYGGAVSSPILSPQSSASVQSPVAPPDGHDQPNIDLKIRLSQYWAGCNSLLISVAPYWLMVNETDVDIVVIDDANGQHWNLAHNMTIAPPEFESTFSLGFVNGGQLHVSSVVSLSDKDDIGHYMPRIEGLLYRHGHTPVAIYMQTDTPTSSVVPPTTNFTVCHLVLHSVMRDGMRVVTVRERFRLTSLMERDVSFQCHALPIIPDNKISVDNAASHVTHASSTARCTADRLNHQELQPLLFWNVPSISVDRSPENLQYAFHLCLAFHATTQSDPTCDKIRSMSNQSRDHVDQSNGATWSSPVWLPMKNAAARTNVSVEHCDGDAALSQTALCTVMTQTEDGIVYIVVAKESSPPLLIHNNCPFPLHFGQELSTKTGSEAATVYEETLLTTCIPTVPAFTSAYYAFPAANQTFPEIVQPPAQPKLHLAGCHELTGDSACPLCCHGDGNAAVLWSYGLDVTTEQDTFVNLHECSDVKVHTEKAGHTMCVHVDPITRAEISAKEIRSRIKGTSTASSTKVVIIEKKHSTVAHAPKSPLRNETLPERRRPAPPQHVFTLEVTAMCQHGLITLSDETTSPNLVTDFISLAADDIFVCAHNPEDVLTATGARHNTSMHWHCSVGDLQLDNQLYEHGSYDFPVILQRQHLSTPRDVAGKDLMKFRLHQRIESARSDALLAVMIVTRTDALDHHVDVQSLKIDIQPLVVLFEDTFFYEILKRIDRFIPIALSTPQAEQLRRGAPKIVTENAVALLLNPCRVERVLIAPLRLLLSIHVSMKLFIACDDTPLSFTAFERHRLFTSQYQLMRTLVIHYVTAMLTRAGLIVGSLDILGNPTGLIRNFGTGVADMFRLPYEGISHGPGAFLSGVSQGMTSLLKHVSTGTLTSITNFASSLSRNMDLLSLDHNYREQQDWLRQRPLGVAEGVRSGLTGFGLSLLGAIAGIADQPLQTVAGGDAGRSISAIQTATGLVVGVGKGLVGVVTKPIGGAAGLVSQTSLGILEGTGLSQRLKKRQRAMEQDIGSYPNSRLKYVEKMLQTVANGDIITCLAADLSSPAHGYDACTLLLTPEVLFIVSVASDDQQRAFPLSEIECRGSASDANVLHLLMRQHKLDSCSWEEDQLSNTDRVAHFIDGAASSIAYRRDDKLQPADTNTSPGHQGEKSPVATIQYEFYVDPLQKQLFLSLFAIAQNKLIAFAFAL